MIDLALPAGVERRAIQTSRRTVLALHARPPEQPARLTAALTDVWSAATTTATTTATTIATTITTATASP